MFKDKFSGGLNRKQLEVAYPTTKDMLTDALKEGYKPVKLVGKEFIHYSGNNNAQFALGNAAGELEFIRISEKAMAMVQAGKADVQKLPVYQVDNAELGPDGKETGGRIKFLAVGLAGAAIEQFIENPFKAQPATT